MANLPLIERRRNEASLRLDRALQRRDAALAALLREENRLPGLRRGLARYERALAKAQAQPTVKGIGAVLAEPAPAPAPEPAQARQEPQESAPPAELAKPARRKRTRQEPAAAAQAQPLQGTLAGMAQQLGELLGSGPARPRNMADELRAEQAERRGSRRRASV